MPVALKYDSRAMIRILSPRAQEILAALDREAAARRFDAQLGVQHSATLPYAAEPAEEREPPPDLAARVGETLAQAELARRRLSALAEAVEAFAGRLDVAHEGNGPEPTSHARPASPAEAPGSAPAAALPAESSSDEGAADGAPASQAPAIVAADDSPGEGATRRISNRAARRLAVTMAAGGASRETTGHRLRSLYEITDPEPTLDLVFGPRAAAARAASSELETTAPPLEQSPALEVIDLHHHLLPGIDDGPPTLDDALALARAAVAAGTTTVVATPHVSRAYPANTAASIAEQVSALSAALAAARIPLRVLSGGEVAVTHAVDLSDEELTALHLGTGPYLLVECPLTPAGAGFELLLESLLDRGHRILLAHPERCRAFQRDNELLARLVSRGALAQITAGSLSGHFGRTVREIAHGLVREGLVHVVASDAHSVDRRPPALLAELEQEGYAEQTAWLVGHVPRAILDGGRVPIMPAVPSRSRHGLKRLLGQ